MTVVGALESPPVHALHWLRKALLNPVVSGSLLLALVRAPEPTRAAVLGRLRLPPTFDLHLVRYILQALLGVGTVRFLNRRLNTIASNGGRLSRAPGWDWPKELAVVSGGCSGIGQNIVEQLAGRGVTVAIFDVQDLPKSFESRDNIHYFKCDVTSPQAVGMTADTVRRELGHPTILVNNAGITSPHSILDMPQETLNKVFQVNTISHWYMVQQFLPNMVKANKGHVVTVASIASFVALAKAADYSATKASALAFHEALNTELRCIYKADNVLTTIVHPNFVRTPLVAAFVDTLEKAGVKLLTSDQVASATTKQIFSQRGAQLVLPDNMSFVSAFRSWPVWVQSFIRGLIGSSAKDL